MLKVLGIIAVVLIVGVGALVAYASTRPDSFRVSRSLAIAAPPDMLFPLVNDLRAFNRWNPYERKDPGKGSHTGGDAGPGASYAWDSSKLGKGAMTITEASPPRQVVMRLDFETPFKATNRATFTMEPRNGGSEMTWTMEGPSTLVTKVMDVVIGMDKMIGGDFEDGLRNLKDIAEKP
jgi:uncharacterized protein YndB with AHSA1/START domain